MNCSNIMNLLKEYSACGISGIRGKKNALLCLICCMIVIVMTACCSVPAEKEYVVPEISTDSAAAPQAVVPESPQQLMYAYERTPAAEEPLTFKEIYVYLMEGYEKWLNVDAPFSSLAYFGTEVGTYGSLLRVPVRKKLPDLQRPVYLVATCQSMSLSHFVLDPQFKLRDPLIQELVAATEPYDGLDVDYEYIPGKDGRHFLEFLTHLKKKLGNKKLRVCVKARVRELQNDVYPYKKISEIADSIMVMAYDEHWSTSAPGEVASMDWCRRVAEYALSQVPAEKLVMGLPFYGRSWVEPKLNRAYRFPVLNDVLTENNVVKVERRDGVPWCEYDVTAHVSVWFDDAYSVIQRARMYKDMGVQRIAFWSMGQEDPEVWNYLQVED